MKSTTSVGNFLAFQILNKLIYLSELTTQVRI